MESCLTNMLPTQYEDTLNQQEMEDIMMSTFYRYKLLKLAEESSNVDNLQETIMVSIPKKSHRRTRDERRYLSFAHEKENRLRMKAKKEEADRCRALLKTMPKEHAKKEKEDHHKKNHYDLHLQDYAIHDYDPVKNIHARKSKFFDVKDDITMAQASRQANEDMFFEAYNKLEDELGLLNEEAHDLQREYREKIAKINRRKEELCKEQTKMWYAHKEYFR